MTWLGESFDLRQLDFNAVPHESGLEDPNVGQTTAVHDRSLGRWREVFDDAQASYIWSRTEAAWSVATGGRFG
jgi:uncharacterized protein YfiM (DUF2279 family)